MYVGLTQNKLESVSVDEGTCHPELKNWPIFVFFINYWTILKPYFTEGRAVSGFNYTDKMY